MAYIERFVVKGLAGNPGAVAKSLDRNVNIFWGLNGSGKTSLLNILSSALMGDVSQLNYVEFESADVYFRINDSSPLIARTIRNRPSQEPSLEGLSDEDALIQEYRDIERKRRNVKIHGTIEPDYRLAWKTEILGTEEDLGETERWRRRSFKHTYLPISRIDGNRSSFPEGSRGTYIRRPPIDDTLSDSTLSDIFAHQVTQKWRDYNSEALSVIRRIQDEGLASIVALLFGSASGGGTPTPEEITASDAYSLVSDFLRDQNIRLAVPKDDFTARFNNEETLQLVVSEVLEVTRRVENALSPQTKFQAVIDQFYSGTKHLEFSTKTGRRISTLQVMNGDIPLKLQSLSSGEKQLLQLTLEVLAADNSAVLIDEPELSLHVDWQNKLVESMRQVNHECQLILATHSPEIMADIEEEFIHQL